MTCRSLKSNKGHRVSTRVSQGPSGGWRGQEGPALPAPRLWASGRQSWDSVDVCDRKVPVLVAMCHRSPRKPIHNVIYLKK